MQHSLNGSDWIIKGWWPHEWKAWIQSPESSSFRGVTPELEANVPGCVQADLLRHGLIDDPYYGLNSVAAEWVSQRHWMYLKEFDAPTEWASRRVRLHFDGLDFAGEVYLNGTLLFEHEGTYLPVDFDVTEVIKIGEANLLQVFLRGDGPDVSQIGYSSAVRQLRPRFCHKWDFSTRMVPIGIWDDVYLSITDSAFLSDVGVTTKIEREGAQVEIETEVRGIDREGYVVFVMLKDGEHTVAEGTQKVPGTFGDTMMISLELAVDEPKLWWPNGYGAQPLYTLLVQLLSPDGTVSHEESRQIGIRSLTFSQAEAAPRDALPYFVLVNGRAIYLKGVNWTPCEQCYGLPNEWRYRWLIRLAKDANVNLIRVWGGGLIEKRLFYQLCDQAGIMVWQDLPQSSSLLDNTPPIDQAFIRDLGEVAESAVRRRRSHVSLTIWCGGNELFDAGGPLDEANPNLAHLGGIVRELDPDRQFLPTTPSGPSFGIETDKIGHGNHHDVHGPWEYEGERHYELFNLSDALLHSEVGSPGAASPRALEWIMPAAAVWPPTEANPYWRHHGGWWLNHDKLARWFGPFDNIGEFCRASRFVQLEANRYAIESNRRRKFKNCGTVIWVLNEPWPTSSNLSLVDYFGNTKPAYDAVRAAFAPRLVSLRHSGPRQIPGERFEGSLFVNNSLGALPACSLAWLARGMDGDIFEQGVETLNLPDNSATGPFDLFFDVPEGLPGEVFVIELVLEKKDKELARNVYVFTTTTEDCYLRPLLQVPEAQLEVGAVEKTSEGLFTAEVKNTGDTAAFWVRWESAVQAVPVNCRQNGTTLWPGQSQTFRIILGQRVAEPVLVLSAFNAPDLTVEVKAE